MTPRLLDLFCGAGGAAMGYYRAGFQIIGVDNRPQPNYPFEFHQANALEPMATWPWWDGIDAIHASPPCQTHVKGLAAVNNGLGRTARHRDLIAATRDRLGAAGLPYVIENVEGAPLRQPVRLCGSSFGLPIRRHRLFESNVPMMVPPCNHSWQHEPKYWTSWRPNGEVRKATVVQVYGNAGGSSQWADAMDIHWMDRDELREAIPPAYTEHVGHYLLAEIQAREGQAA